MPTVRSAVASVATTQGVSVFPSWSVSSRVDISDEDSVVSSSISWSSFKSLYFVSDTTFIVLYYLAAVYAFRMCHPCLRSLRIPSASRNP